MSSPIQSKQGVEQTFSTLSISENVRETIKIYETNKPSYERAFPIDLPYLEKIFHRFKSDPFTAEMHNLLNDLLRFYASTFYNNDWETCRKLMLCSLRLQVCELKHIAPLLNLVTPHSLEEVIKCGSLEGWKKSIEASSEDWKAMHDCLVDGKSELILPEILQQPAHVQWTFASSLRWAIHCFQNHDDYDDEPATPKMTAFFEKIFSMIETTMESLKKTQYAEWAQKDLVELKYNTTHILYLRNHPQDFKGLCKIYFEMCESLDKTPYFKSRVFNLMGCLLKRSENAEEQALGVKYIHESFEILKPEIEKYATSKLSMPFHLQNVWCNYASVLIQEKNTVEAEKILLDAMKFIDFQRSNGKDHMNYTSWRLNYAKLLWNTDRKIEAHKEFLKVLEDCQKNPDAFTGMLEHLISYTVDNNISTAEQVLHFAMGHVEIEQKAGKNKNCYSFWKFKNACFLWSKDKPKALIEFAKVLDECQKEPVAMKRTLEALLKYMTTNPQLMMALMPMKAQT